MFYVTAQLRDKGVAPANVYLSMLQSPDLPAELKAAGLDIIAVVYGVLASEEPDAIAAMAYGTCMQHNTGIQRQT